MKEINSCRLQLIKYTSFHAIQIRIRSALRSLRKYARSTSLTFLLPLDFVSLSVSLFDGLSFFFSVFDPFLCFSVPLLSLNSQFLRNQSKSHSSFRRIISIADPRKWSTGICRQMRKKKILISLFDWIRRFAPLVGVDFHHLPQSFSPETRGSQSPNG
jgi:hypothetical protein